MITSFELMLQGNTAPRAKVTIRPKVQADVSSTDDLAPNGLRPSVTALSVAGLPVDPADIPEEIVQPPVSREFAQRRLKIRLRVCSSPS